MDVYLLRMFNRGLFFIFVCTLFHFCFETTGNVIETEENIFKLSNTQCFQGKTIESSFVILQCSGISNTGYNEANKRTANSVSLVKNVIKNKESQCLIRPLFKNAAHVLDGAKNITTVYIYITEDCDSLVEEDTDDAFHPFCLLLKNVSEICRSTSKIVLDVSEHFDITQTWDSVPSLRIITKVEVASAKFESNLREVNTIVNSHSHSFSSLVQMEVKGVECNFSDNCLWKDLNGVMKIWRNEERISCDECDSLNTTDQFGYLDVQGEILYSSPYVFGSQKSCTLEIVSTATGNTSISTWIIENDNATSLGSNITKSRSNDVHKIFIGGKQEVFKIHIVITVLNNNSFLALREIRFSGCRNEPDLQNKTHSCNFEKSCNLIRKINEDCSMNIVTEDPTHRFRGNYTGGFLFTWQPYCSENKDAGFQTIVFEPQQSIPDEECKISFTIYGKAMWTWWICESDNCTRKSLLKSHNKLTKIDNLTTFEMNITGIPYAWSLEFSTATLLRHHYLGIKELTATAACFRKYDADITAADTRSLPDKKFRTDSKDDDISSLEPVVREERLTKRSDDYKILIILPVAGASIFLLTLLFVTALNRKKLKQFKVCKSSHKTIDREVSIAELLSAGQTGKTLDHILTEGNPNYDWFQNKFQNGYIKHFDRSRIKINNVLGKGAFGEVYRGTLLKASNREKNIDIAIKKMSTKPSDKEDHNFLIEAFTLCKFNHKNIVRCLGITSDNGKISILLELMVGGDMKSFLRCTRDNLTQKPTLRNDELIRLGLDIAAGCSYLESKKFVHRDVAARNCLLTTHGANRVAKIADFGLARDLVMKDYYKKEGRALLPVRWMPPEAYQDGLFTSKSDVWAFGILLWEIFTSGYIPYPGLSNASVMGFVSRGGRLEAPCVCPPEVYEIMQQCWACLQNDRPTFQKVLRMLLIALKNSEDNARDTMTDLKRPKDSSRSPRYYSKQLYQEESSPLMMRGENCRTGITP